MIAQGNAYQLPLPDRSMHCCVTSPPYWGLRKYAGDQGEEPLGLEATPERHIERIVEICREVRRVLRDDGVFWLNYGDIYGTGTTAGRTPGNRGIGQNTQNAQDIERHGGQAGQLMLMPHRVALALQQDGWIVRHDLIWFKRNPMPESIAGTRWVQHRIKEGRSKHAADHNIKGGTQKMLEDASIHQGIDEDWVPKYVDCPGCEKCIPNDGLVLKRGSFRHTRAHEYVFMLVKGMQYWSNQEAVREADSGQTGAAADLRRENEGLLIPNQQAKQHRNDRKPVTATGGRNPRSVLNVPTAPYKGAHYATFPPNLIAPLIRATCPRWACPVCGQGWAAVVDQHYFNDTTTDGRPAKGNHRIDAGQAKMASGERTRLISSVLGYRPTCEHDAPHDYFLSPTEHLTICVVCRRLKVDIEKDGGACCVPGIVFDPFVGSGTTVAVAKQLLRRGIGIDISMEYLDQQAKIRAGLGTPSNALDDLPLFGNIMAIKAE